MSELKPCPFCGKENTVAGSTERMILGWWYACEDCFENRKGGVHEDRWNTRRIEDELRARIAELEAERRWIPVSERLPDGGHREFYEVACIYQDFGELALFSKGRWVIYEGENVYDVTKRVKFWRKRQYLPDEVIAVLSKGKMNPEVQE